MKPAWLAVLATFSACTKSEAPQVTLPAWAPPVDTSSVVRYTLRFPERTQHYLDVEAVFPIEGRDPVTLMLPVWAPGSYLVREFSRNVVSFQASTLSGQPLIAQKVRKNRYEIQTDRATHLVVRYRLYARELTVRTNFVDADQAVINGPATFFGEVAHLDRPALVKIDLPSTWTATSALQRHQEGWWAPSYDALLDAPFLAGQLETRRYEIRGVPHQLINLGESWGDRADADLRLLFEANAQLWRELPYRHYLVLNVLGAGGGGLEHAESTLLMSPLHLTRDDEKYRNWLALVAHEHFHAWNGKRLRPQGLGPFDYEQEAYTPLLWVVEGLTSYYDDLLLARAKLLTSQQYLTKLSQQIEAVESQPGRALQSLAESSFDAWIKFYRPGENSSNVTVSYYQKGAVVGFLLDAEIRSATNDEHGLGELLRRLWRRDAPYQTADVYAEVERLAGAPVRAWLVRAVETTEPLDYQRAFDRYGLRFKDPTVSPKGYLGVETEPGSLVLKRVMAGSPAAKAGLNVGDELIAANNERLTDPASLGARYAPNSQVNLTIARRGFLRTLSVTLGETPAAKLVEQDPRLSARQRARWNRLLALP